MNKIEITLDDVGGSDSPAVEVYRYPDSGPIVMLMPGGSDSVVIRLTGRPRDVVMQTRYLRALARAATVAADLLVDAPNPPKADLTRVPA